MKSFLNFSRFLFFITFSMLNGLLIESVLAGTLAVDMQLQARRRRLFEPPTEEQDDDSRGGASRSAEVKCADDEVYQAPMTALVPQSGLGLTVKPHPTLLVYVPATTSTRAHFTLKDAGNRGVYQAALPLSATDGILQITLPADSPELLIGSTYEWSLVLLCHSAQTDLPAASGYIRRVEMTEEMTEEISEEIAAETIEERVTESSLLSAQTVAYGQAGIWHDMLASLVALKQAYPADRVLSDDWAELLQSERLGAIANTPLLQMQNITETSLPSRSD
ncbi:MAG: DUF928 domain-containing protein [Phormidesmis sp.]